MTAGRARALAFVGSVGLAALAATAALAQGDASAPAPASAALTTPAEHRRPADQTFLTYPEWFLVFSPREYAAHVAGGAGDPSAFPFLAHVGQLWDGYLAAAREIPSDEPWNGGYHAMILVIAGSTTIEYAIRAAYEGVVGRLTLATRLGGPTAEERYGAAVADEYARFLDQRPWYQFDYLRALRGLWSDEVPVLGGDPLRKLERRYALTTEYLAKAAYAWLIGAGTAASYDPALETTAVIVDRLPDDLASTGQAADALDVEVLERAEDGTTLALLPRYDAFGRHALALARRGVRFREIAGNQGAILISVLVAERSFPAPDGDAGVRVVARQPILTRPGTERVLFTVPIAALSDALLALPEESLEHVYDF